MIDSTFRLITAKPETLTTSDLTIMYNHAVETIWLLEEKIHKLSIENEALWKAYEDLSDILYG